MKKHLALLAKLAVMGGLLAVLYRNVDFAEFRAALCQRARCKQQAGRMHIMPAGMHDACGLRGVRNVVFFLNGERVDIRP